jgi:hypothetical protein
MAHRRGGLRPVAHGSKYLQKIEVTKPGLVKLSLPMETGCRPGRLRDLRIYEPTGAEVPYLLERPAPSEKVSRRAKKFELTLTGDAIIILETGLVQPIEGITLETAKPVHKAVRIEGSTNKRDWQSLAAGQPVSSTLRWQLTASEDSSRRLAIFELTLDDRRSEPVTFAAPRFSCR